MEDLIRHIFIQFISEQSSQLTPLLFKLHPITLTSHLHLTQHDLQLIQYLLSKNFITYSAAHLQIKLNPHAVLFYQRVYKLKQFAQEHTIPSFQQLLDQFIINELLPVNISAEKLKLLQQGREQPVQNKMVRSQVKGKGKKKEIVESIVAEVRSQSGEQLDYTRLIYEYSEKAVDMQNEQVECMINIEELGELLRFYKLQKALGKRKQEYLKGLHYKEGEEPLKTLSFLEMYRTVKQNRPKSDFVKELIQKVRDQKFQEYLLQLFRRYDIQQNGQINSTLKNSRNFLLVFNLVRKWPLISQKQLLSKSLLSVLQLRKCLNILVTEGLLNYYPQNFRTTLFKLTNYDQLQQKFINTISKSLLNLHIASSRVLPNQQLLRIQCMISQLDDVLLLFNY